MISDIEIEQSLKPHLVFLRKIHDDALKFVNHINELYSDEGSMMYKRTKATTLNNFVIEKAKPYFNNIEGVKVSDNYDSLVLHFDSGISSRFKKLTRNKLVSNHADNNRNKAMIQGTLFSEYPPSVFIEFGYIMDKLGVAYEKIIAVKRVDKVGVNLFEILPVESTGQFTAVRKATEVNPEELQQEKEQQIRKKTDDKK